MSPPAPCTVERPQACSISRQLMVSLVQTTLQVYGRGGEHLKIEMNEKNTEMKTKMYYPHLNG